MTMSSQQTQIFNTFAAAALQALISQQRPDTNPDPAAKEMGRKRTAHEALSYAKAMLDQRKEFIDKV